MCYPIEILLKIARTITDYDTLMVFLKVFPEANIPEVFDDIGFFSVNFIYGRCKDQPHTRKNSDLRTPYYYSEELRFFDKWMKQNFGKVVKLNHYNMRVRDEYVRDTYTNTVQKGKFSMLFSSGYKLNHPKYRYEILNSPTYFLQAFYGCPVSYRQDQDQLIKRDEDLDFISSKLSDGVNRIHGKEDRRYFIKDPYTAYSLAVSSGVMSTYCYPEHNIPKIFGKIFKIVKEKGFRFFVLILNTPHNSIDVDMAMILYYTEFPESIAPFNVISLKSSESHTQFSILDSSNVVNQSEVSIFDRISDVKVSQPYSHELQFDFVGMDGNPFKLELSDIGKVRLQWRLQQVENQYPYHARLKRKNYSLKDVPGLTSFQAVFTRNIEGLYRRNIFGFKKKVHRKNIEEDIKNFQPKKSVYRSERTFKRKFDLDKLQETYHELFNTKQEEIQELISRIPDYETTKSYVTYMDRLRPLNDEESLEVKRARLKLLWKRVELFQGFLHHLPWVSHSRLRPTLQVKMNLYKS